MTDLSAVDGAGHRSASAACGDPLAIALRAIIQATEAKDPVSAGSIFLLNGSGSRLVPAASSLPDDITETLCGDGIGPGNGPCGLAVSLNERVVVERIASDPQCANFREFAAAAGFGGCWSQPIRTVNGLVLGVLLLLRRDNRPLDVADVTFIEATAQMAGLAIGLYRPEGAPARALRTADPGAARHLESFFDLSLDMLCIRDNEYRFVRANRAWETALGYTPEELEGVPMLSLIHPDDAPVTHGRMGTIHVEEKIVGFINRYRRRDGEYRSLEWRARRVGDIVFGVARDVTDRLTLEAEMEAARQAAEAANRAKSEFLANMSHEIRTPLNGVLGVVGVLSRTELTTAQREMVDLIQNSGLTLERLVSDILDVSKIEAGRLDIEARVFDLRAELDGLLEMNRLRAAEKGLGFRLELGDGARGDFLGDSVRIKQVLGNLLSNAIKFTSHGEVRVAIDIADPETSGSATRLICEVQDTGVGFETDFSATLFQRFSQADTTITRRFGGTGLGLSISKALVEMMGGEIAAESEAGRGSAFRVSIPLPRHRTLAEVDARRPDDQPLPQPQSGIAGACDLRILLAEDHPTNQKVIQMILAPYGALITTVENGSEAVEAFRTGDYDLVLMDMQMPVMDGLTAIRAIRAYEDAAVARGRTPIATLSANAMAHHREEALAAGADVHIAKPVTADGLVSAISAMLNA